MQQHKFRRKWVNLCDVEFGKGDSYDTKNATKQVNWTYQIKNCFKGHHQESKEPTEGKKIIADHVYDQGLLSRKDTILKNQLKQAKGLNGNFSQEDKWPIST